ncbi:MAG: helix-turn-helix transcriptional regulator [Caulobacteraceae bacterium]|nr:helix-turn-helix transcriptional regulator [Caulobacteraceae bacterium]
MGVYAGPSEAVEMDCVSLPQKAESYFLSWAERHSRPSVLVWLADLTLVWANRSALTLFRQADDVVVHGGKLTFVDKAVHGQFREMVGSLEHELRAWSFPRRGRDDHYVVALERLEPDDQPPAAALTFTETSGERRYVWCDISTVFGLTRAEAQVVKRLVEGDRADVLAESLGVTLDTVRTHIRRIYAKLGVGSREQLFSRVAPFRAG